MTISNNNEIFYAENSLEFFVIQNDGQYLCDLLRITNSINQVYEFNFRLSLQRKNFDKGLDV